MSFVNVGARIGGTRAASKKALREALRDAPETVTFDQTSLVGGTVNGGADLRGDGIPSGVRLSVVGPDPYTSRKWYATVELGPKGPKLS